MGEGLAMKLAHNDLNRHFEKSERMNLLQQRIKSYSALLRNRYNDQGFDETIKIPILDRWRVRGLEHSKCGETTLKGATLGFSCYIDSGTQSVTQGCNFYLTTGDKCYDLTEDNLPSQYIELVYEVLPQLTDLMLASGDLLARTIAEKVTGEIIAFLA